MTAAETQSRELPLFVHWMDFLDWLLQATEKFPKSARFSFASRIDNLALDVAEDIVEARYSSEKGGILRRANLRLEKMRILVRLSHRRRYLSNAGYEHAARRLDEAGRMLGGWSKQAAGRNLSPSGSPDA